MAPVWFITGASNGLGLILSLAARKAGYQVIAAMRNPSRSVNAVKAVESAGGRVFQLDMTESQESITNKLHSAEGIYGTIDVLINNAGYSTLGSFESFSESEITAMFRTNVYGPVFAAQAVLPGMRARRSGTIVNISSIAGQDAVPTCSLYSGSKFGLEGFTEALSKEVKDFGISVLIVELGAFRTNFLAALGVSEKGIGEAYKGTVVDEVLQRFQAADGKQAGDPEKAAQSIIDVVAGTGEAGHLKGQILRLVLGKDAYARIKTKTEKLYKDMEVSHSVTHGTDIE